MYDAEIHLIREIRRHDGSFNRMLDRQLGVTCGAVSQILSKLNRKGMIREEKDPKNQSRLLIYLTEKGETAYQSHENLHRHFGKIVGHRLTGLSQQAKKDIADLLKKINADIIDWG
jgi:DNA-binding MarR family transcriptional regulator